MEIAGVDYPDRDPSGSKSSTCLLGLTKNHRIRVHVATPPRILRCRRSPTLWPVAGWLEREVFDMYGVIFAGNDDLRRILTDYGFVGASAAQGFPADRLCRAALFEEEKRVVYEPVELAQDFRSFDFMSPWEGADYVLPGDEKAEGGAA
jgi:NADH-quinone oxidoreductase subunit C